MGKTFACRRPVVDADIRRELRDHDETIVSIPLGNCKPRFSTNQPDHLNAIEYWNPRGFNFNFDDIAGLNTE
jgi:hypothetical protein